MSTLVTRAGKGSPLTHNEVDANFTNLNTDKVEKTSADITGGTINGTTVGATTPAAGTFTTLTATGQTSLGGVAGSESLRVLTPTLAGNYAQINTNNFGDVIFGNAGSGTNIPNKFLTKGSGVHQFATNNSITTVQFQVSHTASAVNYVQVTGGAAGATPAISIQGTGTNVNVSVSSKGTGAVRFFTNNTSQEQLAVSHTTSAVNYVQVTGAVTSGTPIISAQGSDASIPLQLRSKGTFNIGFANGSGNQGFVVSPTGSANYLQATSSNTTVAPTLAAVGSDSNIPLVLQPKGTGALQAQQTDSTATGGNARGANAVDWQTTRSAASQVASGANAFLGAGRQSTSSGQDSFVGAGFQNTATSSQCGVVAGARNQATGGSNFIGSGNDNIANFAYGTVVGGQSNTASGYFGLVGNGLSNSTTSNTAVTTQSGTMNGTTAVTLSASNANIKVGQLITGTSITFPTTYVAAISGTSLTLSQAASGSSTSTLSFFTPHGVVVGGGNNQATGSYSFIGGGGDAGTAANRNLASGDWGTVGGGRKNVASGIGSTVAGGGTDGANIFSNTASGTTSFIGGGWNNTAGGTLSVVVGGTSNNASGFDAFIGGGDNHTGSGLTSAIMGGRRGTTRGLTGYHAFPACYEPLGSTTGAAQAALLVLGVQTTDATATVLRSDSNAAGTTNQVILPNNSAYTFRGEIVSGVTGGGNTKGWTIEGVIKRGANAASTTLVGSTVTSMFADVGAATWAIALSADTTNGGLAVTFTGQAATTIRTVCQIRTTEMTY